MLLNRLKTQSGHPNRVKAATLAAAALLASGFATPLVHSQSCATPLNGGLGNTPISTVSGVSIPLTGLCDVSVISSDVIFNATWVRFVAPSSGSFVASTCGLVNFDSKMAVFTNCASLSSVIGCNDDSPGCTMTTGQPWASKVTFTAIAGTPYYIAVGGFGASTMGSGNLNISPAGSTGAAGDTCESAIAAASGLNTLNTTAATADVNLTGLCNPGSSGDDILHRVKWFTYTATASNNVEVSTCGLANFDTRIAVFSSCSTTSVLACNDDGTDCTGFTSKLQFPAISGSTYKIAIGGFDAASVGTGQFRLTPNAAPPPACGTSTNDCCVANSAPFCSDSSCCSLVCAEDPYCCAADGAWDQSCTNRASILCSSCGAGNCTLPSSTSVESESCGAATNDGCNGSTVAFQPISSGARVAGTFWANADSRDTDWYEFTTATNATVTINLYSKGPGQVFLVDNACPPTVLSLSDPNLASCPSSIETCVLAGTYRIVVAMTSFSGFPCTDTEKTRYVLGFDLTTCDATSPSNDNCSTAQAVPAVGAALAFDTRLATNSSAAVDPSCDEGSGISFVRDVWYSWRPSSGIARISTCGTASFDTRLAVYSSCDTGSIACNDDFGACAGLTSRVDLDANGTTTYLIRLGGFGSAGTGTITFSVLPRLANDDCSGALLVAEGNTTFNTDTATNSLPILDPLCEEGFGLAFVKDVWFRTVANCSGQMTVSTCSTANFDTRIAIYNSCGGTLIACNDDSTGCNSLTSRVSFTVSSGNSYLIRIGGHSGSGTGTLNIACGGSGGSVPSNDTCATPRVAANGANSFDNTLATSNAPTAPSGGCVGNGFFNDVWFSFRPQKFGPASISTCAGATFDTRLEVWDGCPGAGGAVIACNDDQCGNLSAVTPYLSCDRTYLIRIGSYSTSGFGTGTLTVLQASSICPSACVSDLNFDGVVGGPDLGILLGAWGVSTVGDLDGNNLVNGADLGILLGAWGNCPP